MINLIETLFGFAIGALIAAGVFFARRKRDRARQALLVAVVAGVLGGVFEVVVRLR